MLFQPAGQSPRGGTPWLQLLLLVAFCFALSVVLVMVPFLYSGGIVLGIAVFIACFVSTEISLYLLTCSMLLSPEIGMGGMGGADTTASRGVTIRTEDLLLLVIGFAWLTRMAVHKELGLMRQTPLNTPIGYYSGICIVATIMGYLLGDVRGMTGFFSC